MSQDKALKPLDSGFVNLNRVIGKLGDRFVPGKQNVDDLVARTREVMSPPSSSPRPRG